jgi:hypothetical protein
LRQNVELASKQASSVAQAKRVDDTQRRAIVPVYASCAPECFQTPPDPLSELRFVLSSAFNEQLDKVR